MWDERYQTPEYIFGDQSCQWLIMNQHRLPQSGKALSLGDGKGRNGVFLAELGLQLTSVDLSEVGLRKARDLAITWRRDINSASRSGRLRNRSREPRPDRSDLLLVIRYDQEAGA